MNMHNRGTKSPENEEFYRLYNFLLEGLDVSGQSNSYLFKSVEIDTISCLTQPKQDGQIGNKLKSISELARNLLSAICVIGIKTVFFGSEICAENWNCVITSASTWRSHHSLLSSHISVFSILAWWWFIWRWWRARIGIPCRVVVAPLLFPFLWSSSPPFDVGPLVRGSSKADGTSDVIMWGIWCLTVPSASDAINLHGKWDFRKRFEAYVDESFERGGDSLEVFEARQIWMRKVGICAVIHYIK